MTDLSRFHGVLTALLTPCRADGSIDLDALDQLIAFQHEAGIRGLFILGTAGQGPMLSLDERQVMTREILRRAAGRLEVIVHVGAMPTSSAVLLARDAADAGATAIASVPPTYYSHDQTAVRTYYEQLAAATPSLALFAYNNPSSTGYDIRPEEAARLHQNGTISGVKQASASVADLHGLLALNVPVWMANATLNTAALLMGARGTISTITNVIPEPFVRLYEAITRADLQTARETQLQIEFASARLRRPAIGALHAGASLRGLPAGVPRAPLRMPTEEERAAIASALEEMAR